MTSFFYKLILGLFNCLKPDLTKINDNLTQNPSKKIIFVTIDYDKFVTRKTKVWKNIRYECGNNGLKNIIRFAEENNIDWIEIETTDKLFEPIKPIAIKTKNILPNLGTDISALKLVCDILFDYSLAIVANSSCAKVDAERIDLLYSHSLKINNFPFVAGFNANNKIAPQIPFFDLNYPHIITNLFSARTIDIIKILNSEFNNFHPLIYSGFSNKYFAIRYFEIFLSSYVLSKGGKLYYLNDQILTYPEDKLLWPKDDSRISRFK